MAVSDVELRCLKQRSAHSSNRLTESSICDNTEEPSAYLEPTLSRVNESDFFLSAPLGGDISAIDDSIADAIRWALYADVRFTNAFRHFEAPGQCPLVEKHPMFIIINNSSVTAGTADHGWKQIWIYNCKLLTLTAIRPKILHSTCGEVSLYWDDKDPVFI